MLAYALGVPALVGFLFVTLCSRSDPGQGFFERLFLGIGIGIGILTFEMFILGLLRIPMTVTLISLIQLATIMVSGYFLQRSGMSVRQIFGPAAGRRDSRQTGNSLLKQLLVLLLAAWILAKLLFVLYEGFYIPEHTSDSWEHWSLAAKFIFYEKGLQLDPAVEHFFGRDYMKIQRYPLNVPLMQAWVSFCIGKASEVYMKIWNAVFFVGTVGLLYFSIRKRASLTASLLAAFFLSSVPLLTYHALTAYADLPLGFYAMGAMVCFWEYIESRKGERAGTAQLLVLVGACTALCIWTKMEGLFFAAAVSAVMVVYFWAKRVPFRRLAAYVSPIAFVALPWYIFLFSIGVRVSYGEEKMVEETVTRGIHLQVLPVVLEQAFFSPNFNLVFPFLFFLLIFGFKRIVRSDLWYLHAALLLVMAMFLAVYLGTENYRWVMNLTALDRNILTFVPMAYCVAALTSVELLRSGGPR